MTQSIGSLTTSLYLPQNNSHDNPRIHHKYSRQVDKSPCRPEFPPARVGSGRGSYPGHPGRGRLAADFQPRIQGNSFAIGETSSEGEQ